MKMNLIQNSYVKLFEVKDGNPFLMKVMDSPYRNAFIGIKKC